MFRWHHQLLLLLLLHASVVGTLLLLGRAPFGGLASSAVEGRLRGPPCPVIACDDR